MSLEQLQNFRGRENVGIWGPACVQHGFTDCPSFANPDFKVAGMMAYEAIEEFMKDPSHAKWNLEEGLKVHCTTSSKFHLGPQF